MKLKRLITFLVIMSLVTAVAWGVSPGTGKYSGSDLTLNVDRSSFLWVNSIMSMVWNIGSFGFDDGGRLFKTDGFYFPFNSTNDKKTVIFAAGIWIGGQVLEGSRIDTTFENCLEWEVIEGDSNCISWQDTVSIDTTEVWDTRVAIAEYASEFVPGPMLDSTFQEDRSSFRVYKIGEGRTLNDANEIIPLDDTEDRLAWPIEDGAPVDDFGNPDMLGNQMCWAVYNDADPEGHGNMETKPLGVEIQQSTFGFAAKGPLDNVIFLKYVIINNGENTVDSMYISLWADPDVGEASDDLVGSDTALSLGYAYNDGADNSYGVAAPAVGFDFFQGPIVPSEGDTVRLPSGLVVPDHKVLGMSSFNKYINGTDPHTPTETYNYMRGLNRDGTPVIDPTTDEATLYFVPGDPTTGEGWIDANAADRRYMMSTGPFTMEPGDTQVVLAAVLAARGSNNLASITELKRIDEQAQLVYDLDFVIPQPPPNPTVFARGFDNRIELVWNKAPEGPDNYLEDFRAELGQMYIFEGYNIYMGDSPNGPWTKIAIFDFDPAEQKMVYEDAVGPYYGCEWDSVASEWVCDETKERIWDFQVLYEDNADPETGKKVRVVGQNGSDGGLEYFMDIDRDPRDGSKIINHKPYYFAVTSYSVNIEQAGAADSVFIGPVFRGMLSFSLENRLSPTECVPHGLTGVLVEFAERTQGVSDGVCPIEYLTQDEITGHAYEVAFDEDLLWSLTDLTDNEILLESQTNLSGDYNYPIVPDHGIMVRMQEAKSGIKSIEEVGAIIHSVMGEETSNSTGDWFVDADKPGRFDRMNWRGYIGIDDWEIRFTEDGSEYYDWNTDEKFPDRAPFEFWNIGSATPDDPSDDQQIYFFILDDDGSVDDDGTGAWSYGDRIYVVERPYQDPMPDFAEYTWDDDFHIGRITIQDISGKTDAPAAGTVIRFSTYKPLTPNDVFSFTTKKLGSTDGTVIAETMENITVVPNPYYNYSSYELNQFDRIVKFTNCPGGVATKFRIFNLAGDLVRTITHPGGQDTDLVWDLKTDNGLFVASGIYVWLAESDLGQKIGKLAVFVEVEQLETF